MIKIILNCISIIIVLLVLRPGICNISNPEQDLIDPEMAKKIFESMTLEKKDRMNKKEFKEFFFRILTKDMGVDHPQGDFFISVTDKFCNDLPEEIPLDTFSDFIPQDKLYKVIEEVVREEYGEEYVEQLKSTFNMIEEEAESMDDEEAQNYFEKSKKKPTTSSNPGAVADSKNKVEHIEL